MSDGIPDIGSSNGHHNVTNIVCRSDKCLEFYYCSSSPNHVNTCPYLRPKQNGIRCQIECGEKSSAGKNIFTDTR